MQSSYICSPVISMSNEILPSKHEQTLKLCGFGLMRILPNNQKYYMPFSKRWFMALQLQTSSFSATIIFKPVSLICGLTALWALPDCFASTGSMMLYSWSAFLCMLVLGHSMLPLLPGYPSSEELEIKLCSILFIILAKNNRISGKSGSGINSQEPVIPHADWKRDRYCRNNFPALNEEQYCGLVELRLPCWWQSQCNADSCYTG